MGLNILSFDDARKLSFILSVLFTVFVICNHIMMQAQAKKHIKRGMRRMSNIVIKGGAQVRRGSIALRGSFLKTIGAGKNKVGLDPNARKKRFSIPEITADQYDAIHIKQDSNKNEDSSKESDDEDNSENIEDSEKNADNEKNKDDEINQNEQENEEHSVSIDESDENEDEENMESSESENNQAKEESEQNSIQNEENEDYQEETQESEEIDPEIVLGDVDGLDA